MTPQLTRAIHKAGPEAVQAMRLRLLAAGDAALAASSVRCLLYAGCASATTERFTSSVLHPLLISAVALAERVEQGCPGVVATELVETAAEEGDRLAHAVGQELLAAYVEVGLALHKAHVEMQQFDTLGDWPT